VTGRGKYLIAPFVNVCRNMLCKTSRFCIVQMYDSVCFAVFSDPECWGREAISHSSCW